MHYILLDTCIFKRKGNNKLFVLYVFQCFLSKCKAILYLKIYTRELFYFMLFFVHCYRDLLSINTQVFMRSNCFCSFNSIFYATNCLKVFNTEYFTVKMNYSWKQHFEQSEKKELFTLLILRKECIKRYYKLRLFQHCPFRSFVFS